MIESPPENPYASPATVDDHLGPHSAGEARELRPIRPRWWEIGLFAVLMSGVLLIAGFATYLTLTNEVPLSIPVNLVVLVVDSICSVTMFVGGIMALRVWVENRLHQIPPPGHGMMMAVLLGSIISVAGGLVEASSYSHGPSFTFCNRSRI